MSMDTVSLVDVSDATATLRVGDKNYELGRLRLCDYAAAQQRMIDLRMQAVLDKLRTVPTEDAVLSGALADIVSRPITILDLLNDHDSEMFLLHRSLQRADRNLTFDWLQNEMPPAPRKTLSHALLWATNIPAEVLKKMMGNTAPLAGLTGIDPSSNPESDGTKISDPSATLTT